MKIILTAILENISTRADNTIKLGFGSQEVDENDAGKIFGLRNKYCKVLISDSNISPLEEKLIDEQTLPDGKKVKKPSQRLRAVLYRNFEQLGGGTDEEFNSYYNTEMESLITHFKQKLD